MTGRATLHFIFRPKNPADGPAVLEYRFDLGPDATVAMATLAKVVDFYVANLQYPIPFAIGEKEKCFAKPTLSRERWSHTEFTPGDYAKYLGDPYWNLALGHLDSFQIEGNSSVFGFVSVMKFFAEQFNSVVPLFNFVFKDGRDVA